jgi:hypothetical protein
MGAMTEKLPRAAVTVQTRLGYFLGMRPAQCRMRCSGVSPGPVYGDPKFFIKVLSRNDESETNRLVI